MDYKDLVAKLTTEEVPSESVCTTCLLSDNIINLLQFRINYEEYSSRKYLAMSLWLTNIGYFNSGKLYKRYSEEELVHAGYARDFLLSFNIQPETRTIDGVSTSFSSLGEIIRMTLTHEIEVTKQCQELAKVAMQEGDMLTFSLGQKYCSEQVEELSKANDLLNLLNVYGEDKLALALLDHQIESLL